MMRTTMSLSNSNVHLLATSVASNSTGSGGSVNEIKGEILKCGHLRKLKTMKKKFFILRGETENDAPRLEYYDTEKKWKAGQEPKKCIYLRLCFDINRKADRKLKYVIGLYTKDDCFSFSMDSEQELQEWLAALLSAQQGETPATVPGGEAPKPNFEHIWQVVVKSKGLGSSKNILGNHRLCLTSNVLSLVKMAQEGMATTIDFPLGSIRCCGHSDCFFFMELGRSSVTGTGEIWMETEDTVIAKNMHEVILNAMKSIPKDEQLSYPRSRSSSTSESAKPISMLNRRGTTAPCNHSLPTPIPSSPFSTHINQPYQSFLSPSQSCLNPTQVYINHTSPYINPIAATTITTTRGFSHRRHSVSGATTSTSTNRDRSDTMPSRTRTISEGQPPMCVVHTTNTNPRMQSTHLSSSVQVNSTSRPHSMYSRNMSYSPPYGPTSISPCSGAYSTDSAGSSLSMDEVDGDVRYLTSPDGMIPSAILEEMPDDYVPWEGSVNDSYVPMDRSPSLHLPLRNSNKISPSQIHYGSPYMEMTSPGSPMDITGNSAYMSMSPAGASGSDALLRTALYFNHSRDSLSQTPLPNPASANHSRTSSFADETPDGYVPMAPADSAIIDSYVSMTNDSNYMEFEGQSVSMRRHKEVESGSSPASTCSLPSGTPSSDNKFSEYPLEKVSSFLTEGKDDKKGRTYSIGAKPIVKKNSLETTCDNFRVRALSLGSRIGGGPKTKPVVQNLHPRNSQPIEVVQPKVGSKCNSAPALTGTSPLSTSWSGTSAGTYFKHFFGNKIGGSSDLMEMDFSKNRNSSSASLGSETEQNKKRSKMIGRSLRLDSFRRKKSERASHDDYMTMNIKPEGDNYMMMNTPTGDEYVMMNKQSNDEYMMMNKQSSEEYIAIQPSTARDDYMLMGETFNKNPPRTPEIKPWNTNHNKAEKDVFAGYIDMTGGSTAKILNLASPESEEYMLLEGGVFPSPSCDVQSPGDYMSMVPSSGRSSRLPTSNRNIPTSKPIQIKVSENSVTDDYLNMNMGKAKTSPLGSLTNVMSTGRKISVTSGTPPKGPPSQSPLSSPFSSLRRQKNRKISASRRNSTDTMQGKTRSLDNVSVPFVRLKSSSQTSLQDPSNSIPEAHAVVSTPVAVSPPVVVKTTQKCFPVVPSWPQQSPQSSKSGDYMNMGFSPKKIIPTKSQPSSVKIESKCTSAAISKSNTEPDKKSSLPKLKLNLTVTKTTPPVTSVATAGTETKTTPSKTDTTPKTPVTAKTTPTKTRESKFSSTFRFNLGRSTSTGMVAGSTSTAKTNLNRQWSVPSVPEKAPKDVCLDCSHERKGSGSEIRTLKKRASVTSLDLSRERITQNTRSRHVSSGTRLETAPSRERRSSGDSTSSRPNSINSMEDRELNYASLELAPPSCENLNETGAIGPKEVTSHGSGLSYAQIDFARSEGLKNMPHSLLHDPRK